MDHNSLIFIEQLDANKLPHNMKNTCLGQIKCLLHGGSQENEQAFFAR